MIMMFTSAGCHGNHKLRAVAMTRRVKCLLRKHKALGSDPQHPERIWAWGRVAVIPGLGMDGNRLVLGVHWPASLAKTVSSRFNESF